MAADLIGSCEQLVNGIDGLPGVHLPPPATEEQILAAQEAFGVRWPSDFALIGLLSDGLSIEYGLERLLKFDADDPLGIVAFNDPTTWQWAYASFHPEVLDYLYVGILATGSLIGFRRQELAKVPEVLPPLHLVVPRARGGAFRAGESVLHRLQGITQHLRRTGAWRLHPNDQKLVDLYGPIPAGKIVMPGPSNLLNDDGSLDGSMLMDAVPALIAIGELTSQLKGLPDRAQVTGMEPWTDELGRTRLRWITAG